MSNQPTPPPDSTRAYLAAEAARGPIHVVIDSPRRGWLGWGLRWFVLIALTLMVVSALKQSYDAPESEIHERWHSLSKSATDKVAIIAIEGTILGEETFFKKQIDHVRDDEHVKAVVIRVDSPGGTVTGSDYIYHHLKKLAEDKQIPLVVSMGSVAASGGYYVSMAVGDTENTIFAEPTTWTGSIGVIIPHYDLTGLLAKLDVEDDSIASNPLKMMGSPTRKFPEPIRAEEQKILQGLVDSSFEDFKNIVLASRPQLRDDKDAQGVVFTGRIFTAKQALDNRLVDRLGFVEDAIDRALELAHLDKSEVRVVKFHRQTGLLETMLFGTQSRKQPIDLAALINLTAPRAYYLCTGMPGMRAAHGE